MRHAGRAVLYRVPHVRQSFICGSDHLFHFRVRPGVFKKGSRDGVRLDRPFAAAFSWLHAVERGVRAHFPRLRPLVCHFEKSGKKARVDRVDQRRHRRPVSWAAR